MQNREHRENGSDLFDRRADSRTEDSRIYGPGDDNSGIYNPATHGPGAGGGASSSITAVAILVTGTVILGAAGGWFLSPRSELGVPAVEMLAPEQVPEALSTLNPGAQQTAQSDSKGCRFPMGFITVVTPGNPAGGTVIFRTSKYRSPPFHVTDQPQRIAIPNPVPEGGVDLLSADGDAKGLMVALVPPARMEPVNGTSTVKVIWRPRPPCKS